MATYLNKNVMDFNKIMESIKMPKEYYKAEYYDNKHSTSVSEWLKLYSESSLSPPAPLEEIKFKFDYTFKNKNHLPDDLFEI